MLTKVYVSIVTRLHELKGDERGVTAIEYGLIAIAMAVLLIAAFDGTGGDIVQRLRQAFDDIASEINTFRNQL
ncbi:MULTISPECIES: Flp family type IVb pilin [Vibrio]|uniref:Flp family type IVb pilin n=1 Tax=Vibrio TaxID=662 RepID=UPI0005ED4916|nr:MULTISPECIES: Flp family type IVb pilin [Vibrio]AYO18897.1 Flp family type IVb pilin [Vibrio owensii]MDK9783994.1 Flp family type IVb pilin [Vibrio sp. B172a]